MLLIHVLKRKKLMKGKKETKRGEHRLSSRRRREDKNQWSCEEVLRFRRKWQNGPFIFSVLMIKKYEKDCKIFKLLKIDLSKSNNLKFKKDIYNI